MENKDYSAVLSEAIPGVYFEHGKVEKLLLHFVWKLAAISVSAPDKREGLQARELSPFTMIRLTAHSHSIIYRIFTKQHH